MHPVMPQTFRFIALKKCLNCKYSFNPIRTVFLGLSMSPPPPTTTPSHGYLLPFTHERNWYVFLFPKYQNMLSNVSCSPIMFYYLVRIKSPYSPEINNFSHLFPKRLIALHYCVDFIFLSFGIMGFIVEL